MSAESSGAGWQLSWGQRRAWLGRRLEELRAWRDRVEWPVVDWSFTFPGAGPVPVRLGETWPQVDAAVSGGPVVFETSFVMPQGFSGAELELDVGGEGLVLLSTGSCGGLNPYHRRFVVQARPGEQVAVRVEAVPKGLFGSQVADPRLRVARLVVPESVVEEFCLDLEVLLQAAVHLGDDPAVPHLLTAAEDVLRGLPWPASAEDYLGRVRSGEGSPLGVLWNVPAAPQARPLPEAVRLAVKDARGQLQERLAALREHLPPQGALALSGHAHLDLAWLWPLAETKRKAVRTFETVLNLMERFPEFTFNQSSAQLYAWMEEEHPELFDRIRERVQEGRWEAIGGMWVEPDCLMTGGESLARQLLYGQHYFESRFGRRSTVAWLPDTFGFSGALPQLLNLGGVTGFFTTKLSWNETTDFPHDLWWWEGLDGSRVLGHSFKNDCGGVPALGSYNGDIAPEHLLRVRRNDRAAASSAWRELLPETLFTFGYGDGAGGPSAEMLRRFERLRDFPALPRLRHTRVDEFFQRLPIAGVPVWVGELYFELHRGALSSQGQVKHLHRQAEHRLIEADVALALTERDAQALGELEGHWKTLLLNEFHDILPGSSIHEVYAEALPQLQQVTSQAARLRDQALAGTGKGWRVWNPSLFPRPLRVTLPAGTGAALDGRILGAQPVPGGTLVVAPDVLVPPLGMLALQPAEVAVVDPAVHVEETVEGYWLVNEQLRVLVTRAGHLSRVVMASGREVLGAAGHRLVVFHDLPRDWEAWDINPDTQDAALGEALKATSVQLLERGPLRASLQVTYDWQGSRVRQDIRVAAGCGRVDLHTRVDWQVKRRLLKAFVDVNARSDHATFETAFGVTRRPTHRNGRGDAAQFEGSAHRFADLSEPGFGVALLNDGKYGHSALGSTLSLTLLRSPLWPDPLADLGVHEFTYSLYPHEHDWVTGAVVQAASEVNSPLVLLSGSEPVLTPPIQLEGVQVALGTLKHAEDGHDLILRVYEPHGVRGELRFVTDSGTQLSSVNLLEDDLDGEWSVETQTDGSVWKTAIRPFQVLSVRIEQN